MCVCTLPLEFGLSSGKFSLERCQRAWLRTYCIDTHLDVPPNIDIDKNTTMTLGSADPLHAFGHEGVDGSFEV